MRAPRGFPIAALPLALLAALGGCPGAGHVVADALPEGAWPDGRYISCEQVKQLLDREEPLLAPLNVSDEEFYSLGHIPGSLRIPWDLLAGRLDEVDRDPNIVIYCRLGVRSESAYATLEQAGYPHLWVMEGGMERWIELGYPTEP